ncbi:beta-galactosidase [Pseudomonas segetis]|uniref:Beta-galactosidase n=1 Tax=Pseudomonas segetis TaxID=298908 RepID=A0A239CEA4_9PSED|nr:beta-galactosidase [Pseudomonas segetis]SNS17683.1 Beta-galactosidase [Pseudomonas segetis]
MKHCQLLLLVALFTCSKAFAALEGQETLLNFVSPTDVVKVATKDSNFPEVTAEETPTGEILRRFVFNQAQQPRLELTPNKGVWDWSDDSQITLYLQNAMDWALTLNVQVESADGKVLHTSVALPAGPGQTLIVPLNATSPNAHGMRAGPPMPWKFEGQRVLLATNVSGELDQSKVSRVTLSLNNPDSAQSVLLGRFGVYKGASIEAAAYDSIVDQFGQFTRGQWPEKVNSAEQLRDAAQKEQEQLAKWLSERPKFDQYGGLLGGPTLEATGFFRTQKLGERWIMVTPDGNPFFSLGVNAVNTDQSQTYIEGRESMFKGLPAASDPLAVHYGQGDNQSNNGSGKGRGFAKGKWFDFYKANLQRTYADDACLQPGHDIQADQSPKAPASEPVAGAEPVSGKPADQPAATAPATAVDCSNSSFDAKRWTELALTRLQAWGFNTIGNWSADSLGKAQRMPYTLPLSISGDYQTISTGLDWWGGMPDPFDPRFAMATERAVAIAARDHRNDPWLIGYYADNELAWAHPDPGPRGRYALSFGTLRSTTDVPAKRAFLKMLRDKYRNQQGLSKAWGIDLPAWELLEDPGFEAPLPNEKYPAIEQDYRAFQRLFADTYFKTIDDALQWHAPNQMLLGGRFAISTPEAVASCAQYCDVLSFNFYTLEPQHGYDFAALRALDKPILVTEFHFGSRDRGPFWGGVTEVHAEKDRGPAYSHFIEQALAEPSIVGAHWFQYLDQPVTGRLLDGENGHLGLLGITDRPFAGFVEAVRKTNLKVGSRLLETLKDVPAPQTPIAAPQAQAQSQP